MASRNLVFLIGRIGQEPSYTPTQSGGITRLSLATSEAWTDKSGQKQENTHWHNVVAWNDLGKRVAQYCQKGDTIYVEGSLQTDKYDKDGVTHYKTEIKARNIQWFKTRRDADGNR